MSLKNSNLCLSSNKMVHFFSLFFKFLGTELKANIILNHMNDMEHLI